MEKTLKEFMSESKNVSRWTILIVGMMGMFAGAILMYIFMLAGLAFS